ncbi:ubiquitin-conjugating enzyme E2-22 kDa [Culicoides brevitarsis]|uniref:ubiquitin-conjugating enzyme E2-22 kDa n=1 Tax=Culicoides brevitarsis TaxID=469753 RepID=UPI00307C4A61
MATNNMSIQRIKREFKEVLKSEEITQCSIKLDIINDNFTELRGEIAGPPDTPYEGGIFKLEIKVPETYPFNPPKVKFITKLWHPNISSVTGAICLDILKDNWAAAMTLRTVLLSLQALLAAAEPDDPQDAVVATQYKENYQMFESTAKHWTNVYAGGPHKLEEFDRKVQRLKDMGIGDYEARAALSRNNWNLERATEQLFS